MRQTYTKIIQNSNPEETVRALKTAWISLYSKLGAQPHPSGASLGLLANTYLEFFWKKTYLAPSKQPSCSCRHESTHDSSLFRCFLRACWLIDNHHPSRTWNLLAKRAYRKNMVPSRRSSTWQETTGNDIYNMYTYRTLHRTTCVMHLQTAAYYFLQLLISVCVPSKFAVN